MPPEKNVAKLLQKSRNPTFGKRVNKCLNTVGADNVVGRGLVLEMMV